MSAAVLAALGVYIFMEARTWDYYGEDGPGPAFFPIWYGVAMVVLSLVLIAISAVAQGAKDAPEAKRRLAGHPAARSITWLAFALCASLMDWLGFLIELRAPHLLHRHLRVPAAAGDGGHRPRSVTALGFYLRVSARAERPLPTGVFGF